MGFDINRCVSIHIEDQFLCAICCGIIEDPKRIIKCEHIFCHKCIVAWITDKSKCPIDQNIVDVSNLGDISDSYSDNYSHILLKCKYANIGCKETIRIIDELKHSQNCIYNKEMYRECECGDFVALKDSDHNCIKYLKSKVEELKENERKLESLNNELQLKLHNKIEECLQLKKYISPLNRSEASIELIELIEALKELKIVQSLRVEQTLLAVDRELFCQQNPYNNHKTDIGFGAEFNSPVIDSLILELLKNHLVEGARVLDIGSGTGYLSVCMAIMCGKLGEVIAIDHIPELIESSKTNVKINFTQLIKSNRLTFIVHDGRVGYLEGGPYDVINVGVSVPKLPQFLINQLKPGGRMIVPIGEDYNLQNLETFDKLCNGSTIRKIHLKVSLKPLISREKQLSI